jgi:hypothetical protein
LLLLKHDWISSRRLLISTPSLKNAKFAKNRIYLGSRDQLEKEIQIEVNLAKSKPDDLIQVKTKLPVFKRRGTYSSLLDAGSVVEYPVIAEHGARCFLADFAIDLAKWSIRYLIVRKSKWKFWSKTLIPPLWIESVNSSTKRIITKLSGRAIAEAPELTSPSRITGSFERKLVYHYGSEDFKL